MKNSKIKYFVLSSSLLLAACAPATSNSSTPVNSQNNSSQVVDSKNSEASSNNKESVNSQNSSQAASSEAGEKGVFKFDDSLLNTEQKIHTADQQKMIDWGKTHKFYTELNANVLTSLGASGRDEKSHPNQVSLSWDFNAPDGKTIIGNWLKH